MRLLAVETSTDLCSAALLIGSETWVLEEEAPNRHGEALGPMVERLLGGAGLRPADLDALAFGQGPGSFTGIRIGCGLIQGMALGADIPVVPVPSLLALACETGAPRSVVAFDARMGEAYVAAYAREGDGWQEVVAPRLLAPNAPLPELPGSGWHRCGSGFDAFPWLREAYASQSATYTQGLKPHARGVARVAVQWCGEGRAVAPDEAAPLYLRDKVALTVAERRGGA